MKGNVLSQRLLTLLRLLMYITKLFSKTLVPIFMLYHKIACKIFSLKGYQTGFDNLSVELSGPIPKNCVYRGSGGRWLK